MIIVPINKYMHCFYNNIQVHSANSIVIVLLSSKNNIGM